MSCSISKSKLGDFNCSDGGFQISSTIKFLKSDIKSLDPFIVKRRYGKFQRVGTMTKNGVETSVSLFDLAICKNKKPEN